MFCKSCGKQLDDGVKFCDGCGAAVEDNPNAAQQPAAVPQAQQTAAPSASNDKIINMLAYLGILFFLPLVVGNPTPEGRYHANQGLLLLLTSIAGSIVISILTALFWAIRLGFLASIISFVYWVAMLLLLIFGMVNAYNGKQEPLPVIGKLFTIIK